MHLSVLNFSLAA